MLKIWDHKHQPPCLGNKGIHSYPVSLCPWLSRCLYKLRYMHLNVYIYNIIVKGFLLQLICSFLQKVNVWLRGVPWPWEITEQRKTKNRLGWPPTIIKLPTIVNLDPAFIDMKPASISMRAFISTYLVCSKMLSTLENKLKQIWFNRWNPVHQKFQPEPPRRNARGKHTRGGRWGAGGDDSAEEESLWGTGRNWW